MASKAPKKRVKRLGILLPGTLAAVLPVGHCPACLPLYAGILSSVGLGFVFQSRYLIWIMIIFLLPALFALLWNADERRGYIPFIAGLAGSVVLLAGKFYADSTALTAAGLAVLIAAGIWNVIPVKMQTVSADTGAPSCPHCADKNTSS
jgi:hypothetical protein